MFLVRLGLSKRNKPLGAEYISLVGNRSDWTSTMGQMVAIRETETIKMSLRSKSRCQQ